MQKGSGEYRTLREILERSNQKIEDYSPPLDFSHLVQAYWGLKCGDLDYRIHRNDMRDTLLDRNERGIIIRMDRAFLAALAEERAKAQKASKK